MKLNRVEVMLQQTDRCEQKDNKKHDSPYSCFLSLKTDPIKFRGSFSAIRKLYILKELFRGGGTETQVTPPISFLLFLQ